MPHEVCLPTCRRLFPKCTTHEGNFYAQYQKYFRNQAQEIYLIKEMFFASKKQTQLLHNLLRVSKRSSTRFNNCGIVETTADQSVCYNWSMSFKFLNHRFCMFRDRGDDVTPSRQSEGTRKFSFLNYSTFLKKRETPMYSTRAHWFWYCVGKSRTFRPFTAMWFSAGNGSFFHAGWFQKRSRLRRYHAAVLVFYLAIRSFNIAITNDENGWDPFLLLFAEAVLLRRSRCLFSMVCV